MNLDAIYHEVVSMRAELSAHIERFSAHVAEETESMEAYREWIMIAGPREAIRARLQFVEAWMERVKDRKLFRRAVIEKFAILALCAALVYVAKIAWTDIREIILNGFHK